MLLKTEVKISDYWFYIFKPKWKATANKINPRLFCTFIPPVATNRNLGRFYFFFIVIYYSARPSRIPWVSLMRLFVRDNRARRREPLIVVTKTVRTAKERRIKSALWNRTRIMVSHNARAYIQVAAKHRLSLAPLSLLIAVSSPFSSTKMRKR